MLLLLLLLRRRRVVSHSEAQSGVRGHDAEVVLRSEAVSEKSIGLLKRRQESFVRKVRLVVAGEVLVGSAHGVVELVVGGLH